jgi:hypothetical protein
MLAFCRITLRLFIHKLPDRTLGRLERASMTSCICALNVTVCVLNVTDISSSAPRARVTWRAFHPS